MYIREGDMVKLLNGDDRLAIPAEGVKVLKVLAKENKVLVEGVNRVYKHVRRTRENPQGGRLSMEMPVAISNVMVVCPACRKPARIGARFTNDGAKERYCKKCGAMVSELAPPHKSHAKK